MFLKMHTHYLVCGSSEVLWHECPTEHGLMDRSDMKAHLIPEELSVEWFGLGSAET